MTMEPEENKEVLAEAASPKKDDEDNLDYFDDEKNRKPKGNKIKKMTWRRES